MLTPPPSPLPSQTTHGEPARSASKQRIGRRTTYTVLAIPLVLILVSLSCRYITHPALFHVFESGFSERWSDTVLHARHLDVREPAPTTSASPLAQTAQPLPTVPSAAPPLPTPFPQPFDQTFSQNFSSVSCYNFFSNMTKTAPFRDCRPFSLLLQSSAAFLDDQTNLTLMNSVVWGTCNSDEADSQCQSNMNWFANELQQKCSQDLQEHNVNAQTTLMALQAFQVMHDAACLVDPNTNAYCYLEAVKANNPSDLYYYMLPLGTSLPTSAKSSCSSCTRSLMALFQQALANGGAAVSGLQETYNLAAQQGISDCGTSYATMVGNGSSGSSRLAKTSFGLTFLFLSIVVLYA